MEGRSLWTPTSRSSWLTYSNGSSSLIQVPIAQTHGSQPVMGPRPEDAGTPLLLLLTCNYLPAL